MEGLVKSHSEVCQELKGLRFLPYLQARQPQLRERAEHLRLLNQRQWTLLLTAQRES